jgi:tetratricopeptide (TPR) repeat protein
MRHGAARFGAWLGVAASLAASAPAGAQDFDPHGRHHGPPLQHPPAHGPAAGPPQAHGPSGAPATGPAAPSTEVLVDRYTRAALAQPGAPFPLQRLAQLVRERDGKLTALVTDFESRAGQAGAGQYPATVGLAGLYKMDGRVDDAVVTYAKAVALRPTDPAAVTALAHLYEDRGDLADARARYEEALPLQNVRADEEQTLRTLMTLSLDQKDWEAARKFHRQLTALEPTSLFVRGELGRELYDRGEFERAEGELKDVVAAATGDNRALAPALKDLGRAQAKAHENREALATLEKALAAAGGASALRAEIYAVVTEVYRADQKLPELVKKLEDEHVGDYARLALLGSLDEETGDSAKAIATYRRALAIDPRQIDLRLRMIHLLQETGDIDAAIVEYESLIRAAPNNPTFVFEQCEALMQRGDHARALKLVTDLEARAQGDDEILSRVADFYARIGEKERSLRVLERLAQSSSGGDPGHLVDLGDRYFQDGNAALAVQTWKRILLVVQPRARALAALGDVYLEHEMAGDALTAYKEAVSLEPTNLGYAKALAAAYERTRAYGRARQLYEEIAAGAKAKGDKVLARECRTRIVTLWGLERLLDQELPGLRRQFGATPPDVDAGRMLAEAMVHLRKLPEAEDTLRRVIDLAPGDADAYLALERVLVQEQKIADAIAVLAKLVQVDPKRAREIYQRMAQYALQIYDDDHAIQYASRAVELNPDDAEGHRKLGEMYRSRQDADHAITEFRAAIAKNDHLYVVYFELADLLLSKGRADEADRLFRAVVRSAPDEELVARAARLSMQINLGNGTLESLEQDLLPLAIGNPERPTYRRLLVEIYGSLTFNLVQAVRHGSPREAADARARLGRIGSRAVKPLLDALADQDVGQQRIAIDVLAYVQNKNAALPLFAYATGPADASLRARAMIACGALADPDLVPRYDALLFPKDPASEQAGVSDAVASAAAWGLARMRSPRALPVLRRLAREGSPTARALAVLGLGAETDRRAVADVAEAARSVDSGTITRAAAAYALGELGADAQVPALLEMAEGGDALPRRMAILSLAPMAANAAREPAWQMEAAQAMADAVFSGDEGAAGRGSSGALQSAAVSALTRMATASAASRAARAHAVDDEEAVPLPDGPLDADALLDALAARETVGGDRAQVLVRFAEPIQRAALAALRTSMPRASAVLDALGTGQGELLPFVHAGENGPAAAAARAIAAALEPSIVPLARHPDAAVRTKAIALIARSGEDAAMDAVIAGLEDPADAVQRITLASIAAPRSDGAPAAGSEATVAAVAKVLASNESWAIRILAARALGRLGAGHAASAAASLTRAAGSDAYALVREAALEALASFDAVGARGLAGQMAANDPEPRVREAAAAIAK